MARHPESVAAPLPTARERKGRMLHPVIMMLVIIAGAILLTYAVRSGEF